MFGGLTPKHGGGAGVMFGGLTPKHGGGAGYEISKLP